MRGVLPEAERWVAVRHEKKCVSPYPKIPSPDTDDELEENLGVSSGHKNGEPSKKHCEEGGNVNKKQDEVMRNCQQPLDQQVHVRLPSTSSTVTVAVSGVSKLSSGCDLYFTQSRISVAVDCLVCWQFSVC